MGHFVKMSKNYP